MDHERHQIIFKAPEEFFVNGDILIRACYKCKFWYLMSCSEANFTARFGEKVMFRFAFNTAFVEEKEEVVK